MANDAGSFLTKWERVIKDVPLKGHIMEPTPEWWREAASIICGHDFIQALGEDKMLEFQAFVREVILTTMPRR